MRRTFLGYLVLFAMASALAACSNSSSNAPVLDGDSELETISDLDGDSVYEQTDSPASASDDSYTEEKMEYVFADSDGAPQAEEIHALNLVDGTLFIGTATGLYSQTANDTAPVQVDLATLLDNSVPPILALGHGTTINTLYALTAGFVIALPLTSPFTPQLLTAPGITNMVALAAQNGKLVVANATDVQVMIGDQFFTLASFGELSLTIRSLALNADASIVYVGTDKGVYEVETAIGRKADLVTHTLESGELLDDDVRSLALCGGKLLVGTVKGLAILQGSTHSTIAATLGHLPRGTVQAIACVDDTHALLGHDQGATYLALDESHIDFYLSQRWLASNTVNAVALGSDGTRYVGTPAGLSKIHLITRTLADKAKVWEGYVPSFWRMDGFFASDATLPSPYSPISSVSKDDKDNDGLWTQMMIGGWCMAYAQTHDEIYYQYARKAMDNMFMLVDVPAISFQAKGMNPGFISRSIVRDDEGSVFTDKSTQSNWHLVTYNGHQMYWKDDTSSDEYVGHFYGFPLFYDLCAKTPEEKKAVAAYAAKAMDYVINNGYKLIDLDGQRTTYGHWDPDTISIAVDGFSNCDAEKYGLSACASAAYGGGWMNSVEILSHLLATYHMTGEKRFYDAYLYLRDTNRYKEVAMPNENTYTITLKGTINHSDHELAMLAYTALIRYEPDPDMRAYWLKGLKFLNDADMPERNPLWNATYALCGGKDADAANSRRSLQEMPDDIRDWYLDNTLRTDAQEVGNDRHQDPELDRVFPYDEIRTMWWNGNPYEAITGGSGASLTAPTAWLLAYYTARYAGMIR